MDTYESAIEKIREHYFSLLKDFDKEDNHNFRVEIKKLRAFIRLINLSQPLFESKMPKPIKKIYHLSGDVRNLQLHEERTNVLCEYLLINKPTQYLQYLCEEEKSKRKKAGQTADKISFKDFKEKLTADVYKDLSKEDKNEFLKNSISRLTQILALPVYYDETFHDIRKVIEDILYNYDYLEEQINSFIPFPLSDPNFMESLTGALGNFHDLSLALFFLSPVYLDHADQEKEEKILYELQTHFELRKNDLENELLQLLTPIKYRLESK